MRRTVLALAFALLAVACVPAPRAAAPEDACAPACTVLAVDNHFVARTTVLASGATLTWTGAAVNRNAHTSTAEGSYCFHLSYPPGGSASATLRIGDDGVVYASTPTSGEKACAGAKALGGGLMLVPYLCLFHDGMAGEILVVPST